MDSTSYEVVRPLIWTQLGHFPCLHLIVCLASISLWSGDVETYFSKLLSDNFIMSSVIVQITFSVLQLVPEQQNFFFLLMIKDLPWMYGIFSLPRWNIQADILKHAKRALPMQV